MNDEGVCRTARATPALLTRQGRPVGSNMFIHQARDSSLVLAGFLTAQFLQKLYIYGAFVVMGELEWGFSALLAWRKEKV